MKNIFDSYGNDRCFTVCSMWKYEQGSRQKEDLTIVTTFYPMYDFTKEIVGDEGNVKLLILLERSRMISNQVQKKEQKFPMQMFSCIIVQTWNFLWIR